MTAKTVHHRAEQPCFTSKVNVKNKDGLYIYGTADKVWLTCRGRMESDFSLCATQGEVNKSINQVLS